MNKLESIIKNLENQKNIYIYITLFITYLKMSLYIDIHHNTTDNNPSDNSNKNLSISV